VTFAETYSRAWQKLDEAVGADREMADRLKGEVDFARKLCAAHPERKREWEGLILKALATFEQALADGVGAGLAVAQAEEVLQPIGQAAKQFTIHCVGHAHIDMNWLWNWPETVACVNDTFSTVERLMEEFPTFHFSQSQASVYQIMKDYLPELYEKVRKRVKEGRWEVTASQWVEGDKNLASGEILCRHLLYTRRFFKQEFGLPYGAVTIDWEPDTFGHMHTLPGILNRGGVRRYYFHRAAEGPELFWWQGKDGSRVLAFDDRRRGYNGSFNEWLPGRIVDYFRETGVKDYLFVYGVGDHGGGPTRRALVRALKMAEWPVFPNVKLSTTDAFYSAAEKQAKDLPVVDAEMNFVFEGCYTAQSSVKRANRGSENALVEAEWAARLAKGVVKMPYPAAELQAGWRDAMFNQFHDILPGSGIHATYEYAQGLYQNILATTTMVKTRALRAIAAQVDTLALGGGEGRFEGPGTGVGPGVGGGPGDVPRDGAITRRGPGGVDADPVVVFNPHGWARTEAVAMRLWDRGYPDGQIAVRDDAGDVFPAQIVERGNYWGHEFIGVTFPARDVPGWGYRTYSVQRAAEPGKAEGATGDRKGVIENEFLKVEVEQASGAIVHLVDKKSGIDFVPPGGRIGVLEYLLEAPHAMTAWIMGQIVKRVPLVSGATLECPHNGPHVAAVRVHQKLNDSRFALTISVAAGVPRIDFQLEADWLERGSPEIGVPMLRVNFPLAVEKGVARFECANGHVERTTDPKKLTSFTKQLLGQYFSNNQPVDPCPGDVPAQKWMDLTGTAGKAGAPAGVTLLNDCKYGQYVDGGLIALTLLRSSYDPDPLPELGHHSIRFALVPHAGAFAASDATRAGYAFNSPLNPVPTAVHEGRLSTRQGFGEILTANVMVSGLKKAEDSGALIVRLYEMEGKAVTARVKFDEALVPGKATAVETDVLEQPLKTNGAKFEKGVLSVKIPAFGIATVRIR
jgi:alpha-mannosidase